VAERREHKRFRVQYDSFAVLGPHSSRIGQIINISRGGLSFSYIAGEEQGNRAYELGILLAEHSLHLTKIPIETIWDQEAEQLPFSSLRMRLCGLQFGELRRNQVSQLEYFIENYATGEA
jgi:hypothetical protein